MVAGEEEKRFFSFVTLHSFSQVELLLDQERQTPSAMIATHPTNIGHLGSNSLLGKRFTQTLVSTLPH